MNTITNNFTKLEIESDSGEALAHSESDAPQDAAIKEMLSKPIGESKKGDSLYGDAVQEVKKIEGVVVGSVVGTNNEPKIGIDYPGNPFDHPLQVTSIVAVGKHDIGKEVALVFERGDPYKPILMGFIQHPERTADHAVVTDERANVTDVTLDGKRLEFKAENEIVLTCGKGSITIRKNGKIIIKGTNLLSRSSGPQRIKGASVNIN